MLYSFARWHTFTQQLGRVADGTWLLSATDAADGGETVPDSETHLSQELHTTSAESMVDISDSPYADDEF